MNNLNWDSLNDNCEVWCINFKHRIDRYEHAVNELKKVGLLDKVNFLPTRKIK